MRHDHHLPRHAAQWLFNSEGYLAPGRAAELFQQIADNLHNTGDVQLGDVEVRLPDEVYVILRHERAPKGELVLKVELKWENGPTETSAQLPISEFLS